MASKIKSRFIILDYANSDSLKASDIPYSASKSIQDKLDGGVSLFNITTVTDTSYNVVADDIVILADAASNTITVNLPAAASNNKRMLIVKKIDNSNTVTIDGNSTETIDGSETKQLTSQYEAIRLICNGTSWFII